MCKIEQEMLNAIHNFKPWSKDNTCFRRMAGTSEGWELVLHGNVIAMFDQGGKTPEIPTYVSIAGWPSKSTMSRLNVLKGVEIHIKKGQIFLNGREIEKEGFWDPTNLNY